MTAGNNRILIVGNWHWDIYEEALSHGFKAHGWEVVPFNTDDYMPNLNDFLLRTRITPTLCQLNNALLRKFQETLPTAVLFIRPDLILPTALKRAKRIKPDVVLLLYHNDNPFIGLTTKIKMRHYLRSIHAADVILAYRPADITYAYRYGAKRAVLFLPYYLSYRHKPIPSKNLHDVVFIGHYEADRAEHLDYLISNGIDICVYGTGWDEAKEKYRWVANLNIRQVWGEEYSSLISSAKIALTFLSKKHRDVYTRRCFEIPACGTMMIAPRTKELKQLFTDKLEVVYYDSKADLLQQAKYYLANDDERQNIAAAGKRRCFQDGHDETARAKQLIEIIEKVKRQSKSG